MRTTYIHHLPPRFVDPLGCTPNFEGFRHQNFPMATPVSLNVEVGDFVTRPRLRLSETRRSLVEGRGLWNESTMTLDSKVPLVAKMKFFLYYCGQMLTKGLNPFLLEETNLMTRGKFLSDFVVDGYTWANSRPCNMFNRKYIFLSRSIFQPTMFTRVGSLYLLCQQLGWWSVH